MTAAAGADRNPGAASRVDYLREDTPNVARMYDYWLGGKNNFPVDRAEAERLQRIDPDIPILARINRAFQVAAIDFLAGEVGIRQFLDFGTGMPAPGAIHEVARRHKPDAAVMYCDHDRLVCRHHDALSTGTWMVEADLRQPEVVLAEARKRFDWSKPVAVSLIAVLHCVPDADDPVGVLRRIRTAVPPGSYVVITHATPGGLATDKVEDIAASYRRSGGAYLREPSAVAEFCQGLELVEPGLVAAEMWRPRSDVQPSRRDGLGVLGAVGKVVAARDLRPRELDRPASSRAGPPGGGESS